MQTPSHGWPSTWIPSGSSQDITASSHSLIWPPYISPNGATKKNTTWGCVQEFHVQGLFGVWQGTFFLALYCMFPCVSLSPLPLHLHSSTLPWGMQESRLQPLSLLELLLQLGWDRVQGGLWAEIESTQGSHSSNSISSQMARHHFALAAASSSLTPKERLLNRFIIKQSSLQSRKKHEPYSGFMFTETPHRSRAGLFLPSYQSHSFLQDLFPSKQKHW